jgi:nicotinate-nucleotide adenylyltransferase
MKLAIFGGTFDPIHMGHLLVAEAAREQFALDRIFFLPTGIPPHKTNPLATSVQRLAMVRQAIRGNPAFKAEAWEIRQQRNVYTFETLAYFKNRYPDASLFFILGSDSLRDIPRWRQGAALLKQCRFLVVERKEAPWSSISNALRRQVSLVKAPLYNVSSHALRALAAKGCSLRYQVPDLVRSYIRSRHLYRRARA